MKTKVKKGRRLLRDKEKLYILHPTHNRGIYDLSIVALGNALFPATYNIKTPQSVRTKEIELDGEYQVIPGKPLLIGANIYLSQFVEGKYYSVKTNVEDLMSTDFSDVETLKDLCEKLVTEKGYDHGEVTKKVLNCDKTFVYCGVEEDERLENLAIRFNFVFRQHLEKEVARFKKGKID